MGAKRLVIRAACVQLSAGAHWEKNLKNALRWVHQAAHKKANLVAFPENFLYRGSFHQYSQVASWIQREAVPRLADAARECSIEIILGSLLWPSRVPGRYGNTLLHMARSGKIVARYQKIHLFDVHLPGIKIRESDHFLRGRKVVTSNVCGVRTGFSICYDLRFPELYRKLSAKGCRILLVPANFTKKTGEAHWHTLLRARAIENQSFVLAPGQSGVHPETGIRSYGHSLILDPWGRTLAEAGGSSTELIWADLPLGDQADLEKKFPVLSHRFLR